MPKRNPEAHRRQSSEWRARHRGDRDRQRDEREAARREALELPKLAVEQRANGEQKPSAGKLDAY